MLTSVNILMVLLEVFLKQFEYFTHKTNVKLNPGNQGKVRENEKGLKWSRVIESDRLFKRKSFKTTPLVQLGDLKMPKCHIQKSWKIL